MMRKRRARGFRPLEDHLDDRCLPSGYTPAQITAAYGLGAITFRSSTGATVAGDGSGQTIAIVEVYHDPSIQASLNGFDAKYGLPSVTLDVINQAGNQIDDGWSGEETLDVEWAHAIAPAANIVVVEANPGSTDQDAFNDLMAAVQAASQAPGVSVVSMSWGFGEYDGESSSDSAFTTAGVTYIAAGGDYGAVTWPATAPGVLSVGGTSLSLSGSGGYGSEVGWTDTGGGVSRIETEPTFQKALQSTGYRSTPDVAFDADPDTGTAVYFVPPEAPSGPGQWWVIGGTSLGAPAWAGLMAIVNQGRALAGLPNLTGATQTLPDLYALPAADFNKVPLTADGGPNSVINTAAYNTQTGLGTPIGTALIDALTGNTATSPTPTPAPTPTPSAPPGRLPSPRPILAPIPKPTPTPIIVPSPVSTPTPRPDPQSDSDADHRAESRVDPDAAPDPDSGPHPAARPAAVAAPDRRARIESPTQTRRPTEEAGDPEAARGAPPPRGRTGPPQGAPRGLRTDHPGFLNVSSPIATATAGGFGRRCARPDSCCTLCNQTEFHFPTVPKASP
jgi:hypothetical protein